MTWQAGFAISLAFGSAAGGVFILALVAAHASPAMSRLPIAAGALVGNQLATWLVQQFASLNAAAMGAIDGLLLAAGLWCVLREQRPWTVAFVMLAGTQFGATAAHLVDDGSDASYVLYIWATDITFAGLLLTVALRAIRCLRRHKRRAIQFRAA